MTRTTTIVWVIAAAGCLGGCAAPHMVGPENTVRVLVLDAVLPEAHGKEEVEIVGWWVTARDLRSDPNDGLLWGDVLAKALEETVPNLTVHSRIDVRAYMIGKEQSLKRAFPMLSEGEIRRLLREQSPLDFGRSLGADFVVASRLNCAYLSHQRTFHWWSSVIDAEVGLWDVSRGEQIWAWSGRNREMFSSELGAMEEVANDCARQAGRDGAFASVRPIAPGDPAK